MPDVVQILDSKSTKILKITDLAPGLMSKKRDKNIKDGKDKEHCKDRNADCKKWECHSGYRNKLKGLLKDVLRHTDATMSNPDTARINPRCVSGYCVYHAAKRCTTLKTVLRVILAIKICSLFTRPWLRTWQSWIKSRPLKFYRYLGARYGAVCLRRHRPRQGCKTNYLNNNT